MKFKLSYKLFVVFLLTTLIAVAFMVGLIKFYVTRNFADYVNKSLLQKHNDVAVALATEYKTHKGWHTLKNNSGRWREILQSHFTAEHFDKPRDLPRPMEIENKKFGGRAHNMPPPRPPWHNRRRIPRLAVFDANKQLIIGRGARSSSEGYTLQTIVVESQIVGWLGLHKREHLKNPLAVGFLTQQSQLLYLVGGGILVLAALTALILSKNLLGPIRKLTVGTQALASRKFDARIKVKSKDELGQLAADFNTMAQTLEQYERLRQQWISDIAHELRTPLSILRGEIEALKDGVREVNPNTLDSLYLETRHLSKIVNDLHELSLADAGALSIEKVPVDPVLILRETLGLFKQRFAENQIKIENNLESVPTINIIGDANRLKQLFSNLLENTLRYADAPGTLRIKQEKAGNCLIIFFEDSGPGVPEEAISQLFDRLYRVEKSRNRNQGGSGLGLSICKSIVHALGGEIRASNANSGGLRIEIEFQQAG